MIILKTDCRFEGLLCTLYYEHLGDDEYALRAQEKRRLMFLKEAEENAALQEKYGYYYDSESENDIIVTYYNTDSSRCYYADDETDHSTEYEIVYETEADRYQREYKEAIRRSLEDQERALQKARLSPVAGAGKEDFRLDLILSFELYYEHAPK